MFNKMKTLAAATVAATMIAGVASAATVLIDDFSTDQAALDVQLATATSTVAGAGIIGGSRTISVTNTDPNPIEGSRSTSAEVVAGSFSFSNDVNAAGYAMVTYDAAGAGLGGVDLTDGGSNTQFVFQDVTVDVGVDFMMGISDTGGGSAVIGGTFASGLVNSDEAVLFSQFIGVDLASVDSVWFMVASGQGTSSQDFSTSLIAAVPVPAAGFLLVGALGGLGLMGRRRRKAA